MSELETTRVKRLDAMLAQMTDRQLELFIARGEGIVEGYKMGKAESAPVQYSQSIQPTA